MDKFKLELLDRVLNVLNISLVNMPVAINADVIHNDPVVKNKLQELVPVLRKFYHSDRLTALHSNAFDKQRNPCLNLVRQLLKENGFEIKSRTKKGIKQYVIKALGDNKTPKQKTPKIKLVLKPKQDGLTVSIPSSPSFPSPSPSSGRA